MMVEKRIKGAKKRSRSKKTEGISSREKALLCARIAEDYKAQRIAVLFIADLCNFTDYFVICSGQSTKQVQGIADHVEEEMSKAGYRPLGIEGRKDGRWVLMDYDDVIVHVFHDPVRDIYDLESLWAEAPNLWVSESKLDDPVVE
jgi:ribosome-associated protein